MNHIMNKGTAKKTKKLFEKYKTNKTPIYLRNIYHLIRNKDPKEKHRIKHSNLQEKKSLKYLIRTERDVQIH